MKRGFSETEDERLHHSRMKRDQNATPASSSRDWKEQRKRPKQDKHQKKKKKEQDKLRKKKDQKKETKTERKSRNKKNHSGLTFNLPKGHKQDVISHSS